jgi:hypothetical protein
MQVGQFLQDKLLNMAKWIVAEVGKENIPLDVEAVVGALSSIEVTYFAQTLHENKVSIVHRDWLKLIQLLIDEPRVPSSLMDIAQIVRSRVDMHDKFWRYLSLFVEVVDN